MVEPTKPVVWVVDDSPLERAITIRSLQPDYAFEEFSDGTEVVERVASGAALPDVVILDWVMPGMSGDEVCRYLRAQPQTASLPIVIVTASRIETDNIVHGLALGANDYVARPFVPEELRARIQTVVRSKELSDSAARERARLATVNQLGRALFHAGSDVERIFNEALALFVSQLADGCGITIVPGELPPIAVSVHRQDPTGAVLAPITAVADPATLAFKSSDDALAQLPPMYHAYIHRFGLRGLAIIPFPVRGPIHGVVTLTRDGSSVPFEAADISTIETCIEYVSLAVQNAVRFETERSARGQLHAILEHAPIGILVSDPAGVIQLVNPTAARLIPGLEHIGHMSEARGLATFTTVDGEPIADWELGAFERSVNIMHTADGSSKVLAITTVLLQDGDAIRGTVTALEDITIQHAIIAERERVAAFQQQMLGIVGHDLRNPLNAILTGAELILVQAEEHAAIQRSAERVKSSALRMANLVSQLLDVTRARLGEGIPIMRANVALGPLIQGAIDELAIGHPNRRIAFESRDVEAMTDPDRLAQVLSNLIGNAIQYGDPGKPIVVSLSASANRVTIEVKNAVLGEPIPDEALATLFEPYRRADTTGSHRAGLGLGLYIASEIVRAHHGTLTARSSLAEGTVFTIDLPR